MSSRRIEFWNGVKAELPLLVGVLPFGMIYGVLALSAGIPPGPAQAMSAIVFAGSSQFITTQLAASSAPVFVMVLTIAVVNLRHALYSASIAPYLRQLSLPWKGILGYLLTDEAYAVTIVDFQQRGSIQPYQHWFFLGAGLTLWSGWQMSTALGVFLGASIPQAWSLDFSLALIFIAIVIPSLKDRGSFTAAVAASLGALLLIDWPYKLGLLTAALIAILLGLIVERRR